jgi:hypothetical protein
MTIIISLIPFSLSVFIICSINGAPAIGIKCFGLLIVNGSNLVPLPAARIIPFVI